MWELLGLPPQASAHAADVDQLIVLLHWMMAILFVGWGAFFLYTLVRFRQSANPKADYAGVKSHNSSYLDVVLALVEAVLLIGFAIPAWATRVNQLPAEGESTVVHVVAKQFEWHIHYPGPDGMFGRSAIELITPTNAIGLDRSDPAAVDDIVTLNQMHVLENQPVRVQLFSTDVIHDFHVPHFRVKQDVVPGMSIEIWFTPTRTGEFEIACAELCGLGHYRMRGFLTVDANEQDFQLWLDDQLQFQTGDD
jgi:cytochrome c oxidase subunit 2